ncbi:MAG: TraR/DksA family transcriptional regulator [Oligoflexia bacterium]|nr:TraR/DksA family transcriptional regulator [Oligoflexia bacterium]
MKNQSKNLDLLEIEKLQEKLKTHRAEILENGKTILMNFNVEKDDLLDEADLASNDIEQGMKMRLGNRESLYFRKIEEALFRIKEGTYGLCLDCGGYIGVKRLEARPTAELCIECKEQSEKQENLNMEGRKHKSLGDVVDFKA